MAVSLGMRISGLLVAGAVAVAAAAFTSDGGGTADGGDGRGTIVTAEPSPGPGELSTTPAGSSAPPVRQRPDGHADAPVTTPGTPRASATPSEPPSPSPSPSMSRKLLDEVPVWLPPGPDSPNTDAVPDPASVYDVLRDPARCRTALNTIPRKPADDDWTLLRGLGTACLAVQGEGGSWEQAARDHAGLAAGADSCKGRAAYQVLSGLLDFHRRHPDTTVRLTPSTSAASPACDYRIAGVDTGGDGTAMPGELIEVELTDTYFDPTELLRGGSVSVGGLDVPVLSDRLGLSVVVPVLEPGPVEVAVRYGGTEVRLAEAFTVAGSEPSEGAGPRPEGARGTARPTTTNPQTTDDL